MLISFLGLAGSGKTTQADLIAKKTGFAHISAGQLLRESHQDHLNEYMQIGKLINPVVVNALVQNKLDELFGLESTKGVILDGYPREIAQAEWLLENKENYNLKIVVLIEVSIEEITKRLLDRKRLDDNVDAIKNRIAVFKTDTEPTIELLKNNGVFVLKIDGSGTIEETHDKIWKQLENVIATYQN